MFESKAAKKKREAAEAAENERQFQQSEREHEAEEVGVGAESTATPPQEKKVPKFSAEGVLLNPEDCVVGADGVARGKE